MSNAEPNHKQSRFWAWPHELHRSGVLGINNRNLGFIAESNPRRLYPRVDNKLITKQICQANNIPVPETYGVVSLHGQVHRFLELIGDRNDFVLKPAKGAAGRGIIVVVDRIGDVFFTPSGREIPWSDLRHHISTMLSGLYSLGGQLDEVIVEQRIVSHPTLTSVSIEGTPDIRVIVYRGVPTMAMIRMPTTTSGGRANLHQGAAAAAIHLKTGITYGGVLRDRPIEYHPDTQQPIEGFEIPFWQELMDAAIRLSDALEMRYVGVDFVIDANLGPVVLEANARPGLAIQLAHREGLVPRLRYIDSLSPAQRTGDNRWKVAEQLAAGAAQNTIVMDSR